MRALLVVLLLMPLAQGVAWSDPAGDHEMGFRAAYVDGEPQDTWVEAGDNYHFSDVISAGITETDEDLIVHVEVVDLDPTATEPVKIDRMLYRFDFTLEGRSEAFGFSVRDGEAQFYRWAEWNFGGNQYWITFNQWPADILDEGFGWQATLPKAHFLDVNLIPLRKGATFEDITFMAEPSGGDGLKYTCPPTDPNSISFELCGWQVRDQILDLGDYTIQTNPPGIGHIYAEVDIPFRFSNGLETTYMYELSILNTGEERDTIDFQTGPTPPGWELYLPAPVAIGPGESVTTQMALSVPFTHEHGNTEVALFHLLSETAPELEIPVSLWIRYPHPPQPGGHHPEVFFHGSAGQMWMHTDEEDPDATDATVYGYSSKLTNMASPTFTWNAYLNPQLGMGLDFKASGDVVLDAVMDFSHNLPTDTVAQVEARLYVEDWSGQNPEITLASYAGSQTFDAEGSTDMQLLLTPQVDRVPYRTNTNMALQLNITLETTSSPQRASDLGDNRPAWHLPNSKMTLPLVDYHDEADTSNLVQQSLQIRNVTESYRLLNAGNATAIVFDITNLADTAQQVTWRLEGSNTHWATLTPDTSYLAAESTGKLVVRLEPPADAKDGDAVELLLTGSGDAKPVSRIFARLGGLVSTSVEVPDEREEVTDLEQQANAENKNRDSPLGLVLALVALALVVRRKR